MHPVLFELGGLAVTSYGVALTLAFAVGIAVARRQARRDGLSDEVVVEVSIAILVGSLVGSRLLFALEHPEQFRPPRGEVLDLVRPLLESHTLGGLSMSGGVVVAVVAALAWVRVRGQPVLRFVDALAPSVLLGEAITRIGCLLNGCCYGVACTLPWSVHFPPGSPAHAALGAVGVHPAQLYASVGALFAFGALRTLARRPLARRTPGLVFACFLVALPLVRLIVDRWRFYPEGHALAVFGGVRIWPHDPLILGLLASGLALSAWLLTGTTGPRRPTRTTGPVEPATRRSPRPPSRSRRGLRRTARTRRPDGRLFPGPPR